MKNIHSRLSTLETQKLPDDLPSVAFTCEGESWAQVFSMNGEPTGEAEVRRAELTAQGYEVDPGYGRSE